MALLKKKRDDLPEIEASIEKCLMLTRLIIYIEQVKYINQILILLNKIFV